MWLWRRQKGCGGMVSRPALHAQALDHVRPSRHPHRVCWSVYANMVSRSCVGSAKSRLPPCGRMIASGEVQFEAGWPRKPGAQ